MAVSLDNLAVRYRQQLAVDHISGSFISGQATAICGPNGAGKSTLLKAIMGLQPYSCGQIDFNDLTIRDIAYLPQQSEIDRQHLPLTVFELVSSGLWHWNGAFKQINAEQQQKIQHVLVQVGLAAMAEHPACELSVGQFQRVLFARILVQDAKLILLDEPFNAVDAKTTCDLLDLLNQWQQEGRTIIAVLHDYEQVRKHFAYTLLIAKKVIAWGKTVDVLTDEHLAQALSSAMKWQDMSGMT